MYSFCHCFLHPRTECIMWYGAVRKFYQPDFCCVVYRFCYHWYDYRPNWTPLSPITITYYAHKELSLTCVAHARFELLLYYERLLWQRRSRHSIVRRARKWKFLLQLSRCHFLPLNVLFAVLPSAFKFPARMLIGNFDKSLMCSEAFAPWLKNGYIGSL